MKEIINENRSFIVKAISCTLCACMILSYLPKEKYTFFDKELRFNHEKEKIEYFSSLDWNWHTKG